MDSPSKSSKSLVLRALFVNARSIKLARASTYTYTAIASRHALISWWILTTSSESVPCRLYHRGVAPGAHDSLCPAAGEIGIDHEQEIGIFLTQFEQAWSIACDIQRVKEDTALVGQLSRAAQAVPPGHMGSNMALDLLGLAIPQGTLGLYVYSDITWR